MGLKGSNTSATGAGSASAGGQARGARGRGARSTRATRADRDGGRRVPAAVAPLRAGADPRATVEATVDGLGYELVDIERAGRGLLRVTIDRRPGGSYAQPGDSVTVEDCEQVTRQLQYALEVEGVDYARLEVSSPGLDRALHRPADFERFAGQAVNLTLKQPFEGRRHFQGVLAHATAGAGWQLALQGGPGGGAGQVLGFMLDEVREARLVPVLDFKGRKGRGGNDVAGGGAAHGAAVAAAGGGDGTARPADAGVDGE
jgi:ribosome maturation factor RimP